MRNRKKRRLKKTTKELKGMFFDVKALKKYHERIKRLNEREEEIIEIKSISDDFNKLCNEYVSNSKEKENAQEFVRKLRGVQQRYFELLKRGDSSYKPYNPYK